MGSQTSDPKVILNILSALCDVERFPSRGSKSDVEKELKACPAN